MLEHVATSIFIGLMADELKDIQGFIHLFNYLIICMYVINDYKHMCYDNWNAVNNNVVLNHVANWFELVGPALWPAVCMLDYIVQWLMGVR